MTVTKNRPHANHINDVLKQHARWVAGEGGKRANLHNADLRGADLSWANLRTADLRNADLRRANLHNAYLRRANLSWANLSWADLRNADLSDAYLCNAYLRDAYLCKADLRNADLRRANLRDADLTGADLRGADLLCIGNMREIKTMQIERWTVAYTYDTLQIGCQRHPIKKWRKAWSKSAGRKWVDRMDKHALEWADRHLDLIFAMIDASPAVATGKEADG